MCDSFCAFMKGFEIKTQTCVLGISFGGAVKDGLIGAGEVEAG